LTYMNTGTVYGTLLNFRAEVAALAPTMNDAPYKAPPKAPVLYVKPANTWSASGAAIAVPARVPEVEIGATIAMVMSADNHVGGYVLMNDLSIPHASLFRPPVKFKCLDGFLGVGDTLVDVAKAGDPSQFKLEVRIDGVVYQSVNFSQMVRNAAQLLAGVSDFMTLHKGDVLMLGCDITSDGVRPLAKVGQRIDISAPGFGTLSNTLVAEVAA
jgi:5-oxopent-3-ene-1,2,5-tricarboxylate decarboxylase/2-hydroxyhepta-2,4-diene-1,7-dioate isomerase